MKNKRDATPEESEKGMKSHADYWAAFNPNTPISMEEWQAKEDKAISEGNKAEVCGQCNAIFMAFHNWTRCRQEGCPMVDGKGSMLERWLEEAR